MNLLYIIMISIGIWMNALAMSICKGISFKNWILVIFITMFLFSFLEALLGNKLGRK